jgi:hypothetical protein
VVSGGVVSGGESQAAWSQTLHSLARQTGFRDPPELVTGADPARLGPESERKW